MEKIKTDRQLKGRFLCVWLVTSIILGAAFCRAWDISGIAMFQITALICGIVSGAPLVISALVWALSNHKGEANHSAISGYETDGKASTFYVGSRKTGTRLFLRVYDKKAEQIEQKGFRYEEAINTKTWVRFEAVFKGEYAHQLTNAIKTTGEEKLEDLIADKITEKYRFYDLKNKEYTEFTKALVEKSEGDFPRLRLESPRDNDFFGSLMHLVNGSGLFPALYKCDEIWGDKSSRHLLMCLYGIYKDDYSPNDDVLLWLKKHKEILAGQSLEDDLKLLRVSSTKRKPGTTAEPEYKTAIPPADDWEELFLQAEREHQQYVEQWEKYWEIQSERKPQRNEQWEKYLEARTAKRKPEITAKPEHKTALPPAEDCEGLSLQAETNSQQENAEWDKIVEEQYSKMRAIFNS